MSALNFGQLSIGLGIGYSSILIPQLKNVTAWSEDQAGVFVGGIVDAKKVRACALRLDPGRISILSR